MNGYKRAIKRLVALLAVLLLLPGGMPAMAETFSAIVTANSMAVYGEASMTSQVGTLDKNTVVRVTGYSTTIAKISYEGKTGYARISDMKAVDSAAKKAVVTAAAPVYKAPQTDSQSLKVPAGTKLYILAQSGDWSMVEKNGYVGYMKTAALTEADSSWAVPSAAPTDAATTNASGITVREYVAVAMEDAKIYKSASTKAKSLGTAKAGTELTVQATSSDGWAYVELNGKHGFCKLSSLKEGVISATLAPEATAAVVQGTSATVSVKKLAVYKAASTKSKKLGNLKKGQIVNVIETKDGWAYIELNGNYGYCAAKGVTTDDSGVPSGFKQADNLPATVISDQARVYASTSIDSESAALKLGAEVQVYAYNETWACIVQNGRYGFVPVKLLSKTAYAPIDGDGTALQTLLKALLAGGYYDAVPSTSYNAAAIAAIKRFQSACGLEQSGVADQTTQRILYGGYAPISGMLYKALSSGDKSDNVSRLQARLYALGYLTKTTSLDGEYGNTTVSAVKLFQSASGLTATGGADTATLKALYSPEAKSLPSGTKAADATSSSSSSSSSSSYLDSIPSGLASTTGTYSESMSHAEKLEYVIYLAQSKLGCPYVYGATGPDKFDCSGLTTWAFKAVGVSLKRSAYAQGYDEAYAKVEGAENLKRGDIVFFNTISDSDLSDHAGIYLGNGYFIHASSGGHRVVVSNLTTGFYNRVFSWGRRIL